MLSHCCCCILPHFVKVAHKFLTNICHMPDWKTMPPQKLINPLDQLFPFSIPESWFERNSTIYNVRCSYQDVFSMLFFDPILNVMLQLGVHQREVPSGKSLTEDWSMLSPSASECLLPIFKHFVVNTILPGHSSYHPLNCKTSWTILIFCLTENLWLQEFLGLAICCHSPLAAIMLADRLVHNTTKPTTMTITMRFWIVTQEICIDNLMLQSYLWLWFFGLSNKFLKDHQNIWQKLPPWSNPQWQTFAWGLD